MLIILIVICSILLAAGFYYILSVLPALKPLPALYLVLEKDEDEIECFMRYFCRHCHGWQLRVIVQSSQEAIEILKKLSDRYGFEIIRDLPSEATFVLRADKDLGAKELCHQMNILDKRMNREEKVHSPRI
ncbi:MAG: hypothetical protein RR396_02000 [Clostridiales bacterium]